MEGREKGGGERVGRKESRGEEGREWREGERGEREKERREWDQRGGREGEVSCGGET